MEEEDFLKYKFVFSELNSIIKDEFVVATMFTSGTSGSESQDCTSSCKPEPMDIKFTTDVAANGRANKKRCRVYKVEDQKFSIYTGPMVGSKGKPRKSQSSEHKVKQERKKDKTSKSHTCRLRTIVRCKVESNISQDPKVSEDVSGNSRGITDIKKYFKKRTSLSNPHLTKAVRADLTYIFDMREKLVSNSVTEREMHNLFDKWFDTYEFRFYELHNVIRLTISEIIHLFPGYGCFHLLKDDFSKDTKVDLAKLDVEVDWKGIINRERNSPRLMKNKACRHAISLYDSNADNSGLVKTIGMALYVHQVLSTLEINNFVYNAGSLKEIESPTFGNNFVYPTIVIVGNWAEFCTSANIFVYAGKVKFGKVDDFYQAVLMCYAIYFVLWLKYDKNSERLFIAFDKLLNIPDTNY